MTFSPMRVENMEERKCPFIEGKECHVDTDEIPLEVCRLCIDAWKMKIAESILKLLEKLGEKVCSLFPT